MPLLKIISSIILIGLSGIITLSGTGCTTGTSLKRDDFTHQPDSLYPSIRCIQDTTNAYALYLPSSYQSGIERPLIVCLDPHADGLLPLQLFKEAADREGYILAGSNTSRNGMPLNESVTCCQTLIEDLKQRLNIDPGAIYLAGFSGGSRVAGAYALSKGGVSGIIACGAGTQLQSESPFSYLGIAGNEDFNYAEMVQLDQAMENSRIVHHLLIFDGPHQWPPKEEIPAIFEWIRFDRMRKNNLPPDRPGINAFIDRSYADAEKFLEKNQPYDKYLALKMMTHFLDGLTDITPLKEELDRLIQQPEVAAALDYSLQLADRERELFSRTSGILREEPATVFHEKIRPLINQANQVPMTDETRMYRRVLAFLSMNAYSLSTAAIRKGDLSLAGEYIWKYAIVDPDNPEHEYLAATVSIKTGNPAEALAKIQNAFELGFNDYSRLENDSAFQPLKANPVFQEILSKKTGK